MQTMNALQAIWHDVSHLHWDLHVSQWSDHTWGQISSILGFVILLGFMGFFGLLITGAMEGNVKYVIAGFATFWVASVLLLFNMAGPATLSQRRVNAMAMQKYERLVRQLHDTKVDESKILKQMNQEVGNTKAYRKLQVQYYLNLKRQKHLKYEVDQAN